MHMFMYAIPTFITEVHCLVTQVRTAACNDCNSELMPYIALANSYWVSLHNAYQYQGHDYQWRLSQNSCRTCLTNRMRSISRHIMPLVINSLGGGHIRTYTHINMHTDDLHRINFKKPGELACGQRAPGLKMMWLGSYCSLYVISIHA